MTVPNPFVYAAESPVEFFGWLGYLLLMLAIVLGGVAATIRRSAYLYAYASDRNNRQQDFWDLSKSSNNAGWLPPSWFLRDCIAIVFAWVVIAWALGSIVWVLS